MSAKAEAIIYKEMGIKGKEVVFVDKNYRNSL